MDLDHKIVEFISKPIVATLGTFSDGDVQLNNVWYMLKDGKILLNSQKGRKWPENIARHKKFSLIITDPTNPYRYVTLYCTFEQSYDGEEAVKDIDELSVRYTGGSYPEDQKVGRISLIGSIRHYKTFNV
jgi:hypothetical protein